MAKVVFMGTPEFAVPSLDALIDAGFDVVGVFTQPDRPAGRGHKLVACPVKQRALERGCSVFQFERLRSAEGVETLRALEPDVAVTAAFGQILTEELLSIPAHGVVNVHASLLPKHRGSAPINYCIIQGDEVTGVTLMQTAKGIDTGDMYVSAKTEIGARETAGALTLRLSQIGAELLAKNLNDILTGALKPIPQDESLATYEPLLNKEMGRIDWTRSAHEIDCMVRGLNPWPGAYTDTPLGRMKVHMTAPSDLCEDALPGTVLRASTKEGLVASCGSGSVEIQTLQMPGAKRMEAKAFLAGRHIPIGTKLGEVSEGEERE
ncbi:MAG: methionyl-tRNA formyltransferase [Clostridia bacterium]|nr:methionyl-tRNA formyltransferase [Clostridia bacterium]